MKKTVLLFPGQGSQYVGMGKEICDKYEVARKTFDEANEVLGFDLKKLCFEGSIEELTKTENTQPAILTASVAAYRVFVDEIGIKPHYCAGHSLGEISALTCCGAIDFSDALKIVRARGGFMQEAVPIGVGAMAAVSGISVNIIEEECAKLSTEDNIVVVSNYNAPDQIVLSGHKDAVSAVSEILKGQGARIIPLKVSAPFHSPLMQPAADKLNEELKKYTYNKLEYPVISNVTARPYQGEETIIENLSLQIVRPVQWISTMEFLNSQGVNMAIELGPKNVLKNLVKKFEYSINPYSYDNEQDMNALKESVSLAEKEAGQAKLKIMTRCMAIAVCTKNSNWDNDEYQSGVVEPYRKISSLVELLEKDNKEPEIKDVKAAIDMLKSVFVTKKTPLEEQIERFNQLSDETGFMSIVTDFEMPK